MTTPLYSLLVPVKDGRGAKTRLDGFSPTGRAELMDAFARDAIAAARATTVAEVFVVAEPSAMGRLARDLDVSLIPDEGEGDLNQALRRAAARVVRPGRGIAVMLGDLPCLRTDHLELALRRDLRAYVADAAGTGTTLLLTPPGTDLDPHFGHDSAQRHAATGATPVSGDLMSLRLDVDTTADLDRAVALGIGAHTAAALRRLPHAPRV